MFAQTSHRPHWQFHRETTDICWGLKTMYDLWLIDRVANKKRLCDDEVCLFTRFYVNFLMKCRFVVGIRFIGVSHVPGYLHICTYKMPRSVSLYVCLSVCAAIPTSNPRTDHGESMNVADPMYSISQTSEPTFKLINQLQRSLPASKCVSFRPVGFSCFFDRVERNESFAEHLHKGLKQLKCEYIVL